MSDQTTTPMLSAIVAMAENRVIGYQNQLPWRLPADLRHFKAITTGHSILMGRKTYESIGRPLPNRVNIILTRNTDFSAADCTSVTSIDHALQVAATHHNHDLFIIGGAEIYRQLLPRIQRIYLTIIHHPFIGDAYFPELIATEWREISREDHTADSENPYAHSFVELQRY